MKDTDFVRFGQHGGRQLRWNRSKQLVTGRHQNHPIRIIKSLPRPDSIDDCGSFFKGVRPWMDGAGPNPTDKSAE